MRLKDIMQTNVITIAPGATAARARTLMQVRGVHHLVVTDAQKVVGIVSARDMGKSTPETARVADVMNPRVVSARPEATVRQAANLMRGRSVGSLAVLEGTKLSGIVTVSDLLELLGRGADHAVEKRRRWTLKHRGARPHPHA